MKKHVTCVRTSGHKDDGDDTTSNESNS